MEEQGENVDPSEHDLYITQLKEVFDSCDQTGTQSLNRQELYILCDKLQLDNQSEYLVNELLKDKDEVDFEDFKDSFVQILCQTYASAPVQEDDEIDTDQSDDPNADNEDADNEDADNEDADNEDADDDDDEEEEDVTESSLCTEKDDVQAEVSPKYVVGNKRYGRRSLPVSAEELSSYAEDDNDEEMEEVMSSISLKHSLVIADGSDSDEDLSETQRKRQRRDGHDWEGEGTQTFEAEGQLNLMTADSAKLRQEENYVRGLWNNLGVGQNGYITIEELAKVCKCIGTKLKNEAQLQQLFHKLDADGDGRVSLQECADELFQRQSPPTAPPRSVGHTPTRALSAQKKLKYPGAGSEERITPSIIQGSGVTGIFTVLDPDKTGFAKPEAIVDLWETYNVTNGTDILIALGFDPEAKVNLSELSQALEQELLHADEQNMCVQAASVSYQQEIRNLKSSLEQAGWAREKLKLDLTEANTRNSLLAKEVDERHASMEKSTESKIFTIEKKYQEHLRQLQGELEKERENFTVYTARNKQTMEADMGELRHEEAKLREQLSLMQKEIDKMSRDLETTTCQLDESERQNKRLLRELDSMEDIHRKLSEFENAGIQDPEEHKFAQEKIQRLEQENKDLKDHNDELRTELEQAKVTAAPVRRPSVLDSTETQTSTPIRKEGSFMSRYIKPFVPKNTSFSSVDYSDDETPGLAAPGSVNLPKDDDDISLGSTSEAETIDQLRREIQDLQQRFEMERKDIAESYRLEIAAIEEKHSTEKQQVIELMQRERRTLEGEFEKLQEEALSELARELQTNFAHEKEDLVKKHESEKNYMKQIHTEERQQLLDRLQVEGDHNVKSKIQELKARHAEDRAELEQALDDSEARIQDLEDKKKQVDKHVSKLKQQITELEEQKTELEEEKVKNKRKIEKLEQSVKAQQEENERDMLKQKAEMEGMLSRHLQNVSNVEGEKHEMELKYTKQLNEEKVKSAERILELEKENTDKKQQLKELKNKVTQLEEEVRQQEEDKQNLSNIIEGLKLEIRESKTQISQMDLEVEQQKEEIEVSYSQEKLEIRKVYEGKLKELQDDHDQREAHMTKVNEGKLKELQDVHDQKEAYMTKVYEGKLKELQDDLDQREANMEKVYEGKLKELQDDLDQKDSELRKVYEGKIRELEDTLDLKNKQIERKLKELETDQDQKDADVKRVYEKKLREMEAVHDEKETQIKKVYDRKLKELQEDLDQRDTQMTHMMDGEKQEIKKVYDRKIRQLQIALDEKETQMDHMLDRGVDSLTGKLRDDFYRLLDQQKGEVVLAERTTFADSLTKKEAELEKDFDRIKSELAHVFEKERSEIVEKYEAQIYALKVDLERLEGKVEEEREALASRYEADKEGMEEQLAQQIKDELEEELCDQMEEIKEAYDDAQRGFEAESRLLKEEIEDLKLSLEKETKNRQQLEEVRRANNKLQIEKRQTEKAHHELKETLADTRQSLEARIDELMAEKEGAVSAVKAELVESSRQSGRDKAGYDAVIIEKESLENKVSQMNQELQELQNKADSEDRLQAQVERLTRENTDLTTQIQSQAQVQERSEVNSVPEHAQRAIDELTKEKSDLEERLMDTENKLAEIEEMARKYTHLQFDLGQLSIGQSALEESLLETQDKLADTEAQLYQSEKELKDARRYVDKYKLLQKKYEDVCRERDRTVNTAKALKEQLNKVNSGQKEEHEDKKQVTKILEEKKQLEAQLQKVSDKLLEATTNFTVSQGQHIQELQQWKEQCSNMVDLQRYTKLQIDLVDHQKSLRETQEMLKSKEDMTNKMFKVSSDKHRTEVTDLEDRKYSLEEKLKTLQLLLDNHVKKFKEQCETGERRNQLVVDLYKENADLMENLANVEVQKKDAVSRCYRLEDQCNELRRTLKKMTKLAVNPVY